MSSKIVAADAAISRLAEVVRISSFGSVMVHILAQRNVCAENPSLPVGLHTSRVAVVEICVPTARGPGRLVVDAAEQPAALLWLGHGAGGGIEAADLAALAGTLPAQGISVVRFEQPWRTAGRRVAAPPAALDRAWLEAAPIVERLAQGLPLVTGGRSSGARVACRTVASVGAVALVCLAFPLHPPGKPGTSRLSELLGPDVPILVMQGERDPFGRAPALASAVAGRPNVRVVAVPDAGHGMKVSATSPATAAGVATLLTSSVAAFIREVC